MILYEIQKPVFIPTSIPTVFQQLRDKGILTGIATGRGIFGVVPEIKALKPDFFVTLMVLILRTKRVMSFIVTKLLKIRLKNILLGPKKLGLIMVWWEVMLLNYQGEQR